MTEPNDDQPVDPRLEDLQPAEPDTVLGGGEPPVISDLQPNEPDVIKKHDQPAPYETKGPEPESREE